MRAFSYERARSPAEAAKAVAGTEGAKFLAGGTNLLDLMKLEVETPAHLVDVQDIGLDRIEPTDEGGLRIGTLVTNTALASHERVRRDYAVLTRAIVAGASGSCATKPPPAATCCSARAARISTTPICPATSACPDQAAARSRDSPGRWA